MKDLEVLIKVIEIVLYVSMPLFIASTAYLILVVKKSNYALVKEAISNPILSDIDFKFFKKLRIEYLKVRKHVIPAFVNKITFWTMVGGFSLLFILVIIQELIKA